MNKSLEEIGVILSGKDYKSNPPGDNVPIYGTGGIMGYTSIPLNQGASVLTGRKGTINRPIYVEGDFWNVDTIFCVKANDGVDTKWLYYSFLNTDISKLNEATGVPSVSSKALYKLKFKWFELPEQRQIATILSTADAVIEKTQAAIAKYKAIKQGMLQDSFTRGIDTTTGKLRPSYQDAPELYKESKLGWIPKEWEVERIDKLCQITTGNKDTQNKLEYGVYPFFVRSQTIEKINSYSYDGEAILTAGDGVGVGKIYHYINGKFDFHQRVYMLYEFEKTIAPKFLFYFFSNNFLAEVDRCSAKTTVDSVRMEMIAGMKIPLPDISEQISIAEKLITLESKLQTEQDFLHKQQQIKAGLMNDLLSGRKKVVMKEEIIQSN